MVVEGTSISWSRIPRGRAIFEFTCWLFLVGIEGFLVVQDTGR